MGVALQAGRGLRLLVAIELNRRIVATSNDRCVAPGWRRDPNSIMVGCVLMVEWSRSGSTKAPSTRSPWRSCGNTGTVTLQHREQSANGNAERKHRESSAAACRWPGPGVNRRGQVAACTVARCGSRSAHRERARPAPRGSTAFLQRTDGVGATPQRVEDGDVHTDTYRFATSCNGCAYGICGLDSRRLVPADWDQAWTRLRLASAFLSWSSSAL